ncbi:uncharacterized protein [Setaria viridis]|uniref:Uncharacterized protein n=1 Tax=Setaria viridis TaxID=4556 RepID=A0A4U6TPL4_SETVI|nr:uncharacterized protein LOC117865693 [Setaria viridis]TKW04571.1 hypothetical protein SEVIR_7G118850v2 [Setaria viridis]
MGGDDQKEEVVESSSCTSSDAADEVRAPSSAKVGSSSAMKKCSTTDELEAAIPPPPKKKRAVIAKRSMKKSISEDDVPPKVLELAMDAEKATALAAQDKSPIIEEVINIEYAPEPPIVVDSNTSGLMVDPVSARITRTAEAVAKAGNDRATTIQATPKGPSPTIKPLRLIGEPSLKLRRSTRISSDMDLSRPDSGPSVDGDSHSTRDIIHTQAVLPPQEQIMEKPSTPRATSAVVALMHEVLASSIDVVPPAPER